MQQAEKTVPAPRGVGKSEPRTIRQAAKAAGISTTGKTPRQVVAEIHRAKVKFTCPACDARMEPDPRPLYSDRDTFAWCPRCRATGGLIRDRLFAEDDSRDLLGLVRAMNQHADSLAENLPHTDPVETLARRVASIAGQLEAACETMHAALAMNPGQRLPGWKHRRAVRGDV